MAGPFVGFAKPEDSLAVGGPGIGNPVFLTEQPRLLAVRTNRRSVPSACRRRSTGRQATRSGGIRRGRRAEIISPRTAGADARSGQTGDCVLRTFGIGDPFTVRRPARRILIERSGCERHGSARACRVRQPDLIAGSLRVPLIGDLLTVWRECRRAERQRRLAWELLRPHDQPLEALPARFLNQICSVPPLSET